MVNRRLGAALLSALLSGAIVFAVLTIGNRNNVAIIDVNRREPGVVVLVVESCNGAPEAAVTDLIKGRYSVGVETTVSWNRGNECADAVEIGVDPELESFEIEDIIGGTVFTVP